tara:strand:- start:39 stop:695 length:657 start_codon:yes stop_codon:yes gene_type:complete
MSCATTAVTLNFSSTVGTSASNDAVVLTVTAGEEENVMEALAGAIANARAGMTVVASDVSGKTSYLVPGITAVSSISVDNGAGTFKNIINGVMDGSSADLGGTAHSLVFTNAHSGSTVVLAATTATSTMTLPTSPIDGFNLRFVAAADNSAHTNTVAGSFDGVLSDGGDNTSVTGTTAFVIVASKLKKGDIIDIVYSGLSSKYYLRAILKTADGVTVS